MQMSVAGLAIIGFGSFADEWVIFFVWPLSASLSLSLPLRRRQPGAELC